MTILVVILTLVAIGVSTIMWYRKSWAFEQAFLVMLIAVTALGLYTIQKINADNLKDSQYQACLRANVSRDAARQFALKNSDLPGTAALLIANRALPCEELYDRD